MTRAHLRANWIEPPSLTELWLGALLRAFAMLVSYAASIVRMRLSPLSGECHTDAEPETLPEPESGILMETKEAATSNQSAAEPKLTRTPSRRRCGDGGGGGGGGGGGDNALTFPPAASPTGPRDWDSSSRRASN